MTLPWFARTRIATGALAVLAVLLCTAADASAQRLKVILDTDIGSDIDDAWALGLRCCRPTSSCSASPSPMATPGRARRSPASCCTSGGRDDVPVAVGRPTPPPDQIDLQFAWAEDFTAKQPVPQSAADFIVDTVRRYPGEVTLVAVGPLQNVADALRKDPRLGTAAQARGAHERIDCGQRVGADRHRRVERRQRRRRTRRWSTQRGCRSRPCRSTRRPMSR